MLELNTSFEQYIDPSEQCSDKVQIEVAVVAHDEMSPEVDTSTPRKGMIFTPSEVLIHGYTAGCVGCVNLRRKTGLSENHSESCRLRMEECLVATAERPRNQRLSARREEKLTREFEAEDEK